MNCQQWSMSNKFISTVPLRVFQRLSSFLVLPGCASRWTVQWPPRCHLTWRLNIHKKPSGWSFVIQNCLTPVSWKLFRALQRWAFHTSWTAQVSCIQNSQYRWLGFDCENMQIVNIGHSMHAICNCMAIPFNKGIPIQMTELFTYPGTWNSFGLTPPGQAVVYRELRKIYWNLHKNTKISYMSIPPMTLKYRGCY